MTAALVHPPFERRIRVPAEVIVSESEREAVVLHTGTSESCGFDEVGTRMWMALATTGSVPGAHETLVREYLVDPHVLREDLLAMVEQLLRHGLLELANA